MVRICLLAGYCCALLLANRAAALEPAPPSAEAVREYELQRLNARQLIQQRAINLSRARIARMEARKRAGISLQRPHRMMPWYQ